MIRLTRKAREQHRHSRAVVLQELGTPTATAAQQDIAANKAAADRLRQQARARAVRQTSGENQ